MTQQGPADDHLHWPFGRLIGSAQVDDGSECGRKVATEHGQRRDLDQGCREGVSVRIGAVALPVGLEQIGVILGEGLVDEGDRCPRVEDCCTRGAVGLGKFDHDVPTVANPDGLTIDRVRRVENERGFTKPVLAAPSPEYVLPDQVPMPGMVRRDDGCLDARPLVRSSARPLVGLGAEGQVDDGAPFSGIALTEQAITTLRHLTRLDVVTEDVGQS